jgi:hypothetical protein
VLAGSAAVVVTTGSVVGVVLGAVAVVQLGFSLRRMLTD